MTTSNSAVSASFRWFALDMRRYAEVREWAALALRGELSEPKTQKQPGMLSQRLRLP